VHSPAPPAPHPFLLYPSLLIQKLPTIIAHSSMHYYQLHVMHPIAPCLYILNHSYLLLPPPSSSSSCFFFFCCCVYSPCSCPSCCCSYFAPPPPSPVLLFAPLRFSLLLLLLLKTVIRGAKIIFSVTLRVFMGRVGFIAHIRVIGVWGVHFHRLYGPQHLGKCCKLAWEG
jgi:hypothetical protein